MKNLFTTSKVFKLATYIFIFSILFLSTGCNCDADTSDCGCDSEIKATLPVTTEFNGQIAIKRRVNSSDTFYNNKYWITYISPDCPSCIHHYIICNEEMLTAFSDLQTLPLGQSVAVKFAGDLRETCAKTISPATETFEHITLSKIERQ
jgi:hypothetical protein